MNFVFSALNFLYFSISWSFFLYLPVFYKTIGLNDMQIGILVSLVSFTSILFAVPFGILTDIVRPRIIVMLGSLFILLFSLLIYLVGELSFYFLLILMIFFGLSYIMFNVGLTSFFLKRVGQEARGRQISGYYFSLYLGFSIGILLSGYIVEHYTFDAMFRVVLFQTILLFALSMLLPREEPIPFKIKDYIKDIKRWDVLIFTLIMFVYGYHTGTEQTSFALFAENIAGISQGQVGQIFFLLGIWLGLVNLWGGRVFDKYRDISKLVLFALVVSGFFQFFTIFARNFTSLFIIRLFHTFGDSIIYLGRALFISMIFVEARVGGNFGFSFFIQTTGMVFGAFLAGYLQGEYGYKFPFAVSGILNIILALILFFDKRYFKLSWSRFKEGHDEKS